MLKTCLKERGGFNPNRFTGIIRVDSDGKRIIISNGIEKSFSHEN